MSSSRGHFPSASPHISTWVRCSQVTLHHLPGRKAHSPGHVPWGPPKLQLMAVSMTSRSSIGWGSSKPLGCPRAGRNGREARPSTILYLLFQSRLEEDLESGKVKRCSARRPNSCSLRGKLTRAVRSSSIGPTPCGSAVSTPPGRW